MTPHRRYGRADGVPAGGIRHDGGNPKMTTRDQKRAAAERIKARQDAALAAVRDQHKTARRGYNRDDLSEGPTKPAAS